jgi:hypothetical protein
LVYKIKQGGKERLGTFTNALLNLLNVNDNKPVGGATRVKFLTDFTPLFSDTNGDVFASDIVKTAIHRICEEVSKCQIKSVRVVEEQTKITTINNDNINRTLSNWVNPFCVLKDFLYKLTFTLLTNENVFIYWHFDELPQTDGSVRRETRGFYIIDCDKVKIYVQGDEARIEFQRKNEVIYDMPYHDIIHIRNKYGRNKFLGGDIGGNFDARGILKNLKTMQVIQESVPKSLEAALRFKGVLSMKTVADIDKKNITRGEFEKHLFSSDLGIVVTDYEADFHPINIPLADLPKNTLEFIRDEMLSPFGVSLPIYLGKYTDEEFSSFYQTAVEGILLAIGQTFQAVLFTPNQYAHGNRIKVYDRLVQSLSFKQRKDIVIQTMQSALLNRDEQRELLGFEPDGKPTRISLNYIDETIATQYQLELQLAKKGGKENAE